MSLVRRRDLAVQRSVEVVTGGVAARPRRVAEVDEQHESVALVGAGAPAGQDARREVPASDSLVVRVPAGGWSCTGFPSRERAHTRHEHRRRA